MRLKRLRRARACGAALALALASTPLTVACAGIVSTADEAASSEAVASFTLDLAPSAASLGASLVTRDAYASINDWFDTYARSRVVEVATDLTRARVAVGPWEAAADYGATDAREDGTMTEWASRYYIAHDWSDYGQQILALSIGDTFCVNGVTVEVDGVFNYPKASFLNEVRCVCGDDSYILQTCLPGADLNRIVFGHAIG